MNNKAEAYRYSKGAADWLDRPRNQMRRQRHYSCHQSVGRHRRGVQADRRSAALSVGLGIVVRVRRVSAQVEKLAATR